MHFSSSLLCAFYLFSIAATTPASLRRQPLRFTQDGTFQLSIFEDLHFGEAEDLDWGPQQDINTTRVMNSVLDEEKPQLVVLNGDLITGENTYLRNSSHYVDQIIAPLLERDLLWASTYGNHDSDFNLSRHAVFAREHRWSNTLTRQDIDGATSGVSNYYLPVYSYEHSKHAPELLLWFFDSRGGNYYQQEVNGTSMPQPGWVDQTAVDWFEATNIALTQKYRKHVPSLAFVHIPVHAMLAFQQQRDGTGVRAHYEPGINDDNPLDPQGMTEGQGDVSGTVSSYGGQDIPFMQALRDTPGLTAVFSGHDHGDDWCFRWAEKLPGMNLTGNGLDLCFGRHSGYGGYGRWTRGSRQVLVSEQSLKKRELETWVRLETGEVSGQVTLNGTYGRDYYPAVADTSST